MAKKRKSIYDKPLKDINKDGKVNFGDTWLGDALGFDGKMGIQKGRPGLKESLKGARRGKTETGKKEDKPQPRPRSRPSGSTSTRSGPAGASGTGSGPTQGGAGGPASKRTTDSGMGDKASATRESTSKMMKQRSSPSPDKYNVMMGKMSDTQTKQFRALSPADKMKVYRRYVTSGKISLPSPKRGTQVQPPIKTKTGMAKGGMARFKKSGNTDYKGKGMFYDSKSPRGYK